MTNKEIGQRITMAREKANLNKQELAERVGVASSTIKRYEYGEIAKIKLPIIESIANILSVNPMWIIGKSEDPNANHYSERNVILDEPAKKLLTIFHQLDDTSKKELLDYAEFKEHAYKADPDLKDAENIAYEYIKECDEEENGDEEKSTPDQPEKIG